MLAAGHVAMSAFYVSTAITLKSLRKEMARVNPIAGMFSPYICEQLFINTPLPKLRSSRESSRQSTRRMSPPRRVSLSTPLPVELQVTPSLMRISHHTTSPSCDTPQPPSMRSHPIHITTLPPTPTPVGDSPSLSHTQGAYGSPITCLPSPTIISPSISPIPPEGTNRDCESPQFYTAPTTFVNKTYVNSPARLSEHKVVRPL
jgi:hypothetical protein